MTQLHSKMMFDFDATNVVRSCYLAGAATGIILCAVPWLKNNVVNYGTRSQPAQDDKKTDGDSSGSPPKPAPSAASWLRVITDGVPHSWFVHYYVLSVSLSLFWGLNLLVKGPAFMAVSRHVDTSPDAPAMRISQVHMAWFLMLIQGCRRLLESRAFMKESPSRMPWSIYAIGLVYYINMSVAVWIEGTKAVADEAAYHLVPPLPSPRTTVGTVLFILASGIQHDCHAYLASLPKYTLPVHPAFHRIVCPHYTAEAALYLALAFIAAPSGQMFNWTLLSNVVFVVVNLGLVADETKRWSERKFGKASVKDRARMIPYVW